MGDQKTGKSGARSLKGTALEEGKLVSTFLYSMGDVVYDILATLTGVDEATTACADLSAAFDAHFGGRKNTIFARVKFNRRVQRMGETVDNFIQDLHKLAEDCEYGALKDELIRDRIVVGVSDDDLSNLLQTKANLTLAEAIQSSRQAETRKEGQALLRGNQADSLRFQSRHRNKSQQRSFPNSPGRQLNRPTPSRGPPTSSRGPNNQPRCQYCGHEKAQTRRLSGQTGYLCRLFQEGALQSHGQNQSTSWRTTNKKQTTSITSWAVSTQSATQTIGPQKSCSTASRQFSNWTQGHQSPLSARRWPH